MLIDLSPPLSDRLAPWPGDTRFARDVRHLAAGPLALTTSALRVSAHCGAHLDAPRHYDPNGLAIDACGLDDFIGPCEVVRVAVGRAALVTPAHLPAAADGHAWSPRAPRVLFATGTYPDPTVFTTDFAGLAVELIDRLADAGVRLVGIDTPSVDCYADGDLPAHARLRDRDLRILEGLRLDAAPAGLYELIALPLRIRDGDGSPVRAVLRPAAPGGNAR